MHELSHQIMPIPEFWLIEISQCLGLEVYTKEGTIMQAGAILVKAAHWQLMITYEHANADNCNHTPHTDDHAADAENQSPSDLAPRPPPGVPRPAPWRG